MKKTPDASPNIVWVRPRSWFIPFGPANEMLVRSR